MLEPNASAYLKTGRWSLSQRPSNVAPRTRQALRFLAAVSAPYLRNPICRDRLIQLQDVLTLRARFYVAGFHATPRALGMHSRGQGALLDKISVSVQVIIERS